MDDGQELKWSVHHLQRNPQKAVFVFLAICVALIFGFLLFRHWFPALAGGVLIFSATIEYLLPIKYRMNSSGAELKCLWIWRVIEWKDVKQVYIGKDGVKLSPLPNKSRLEAYRGVFLFFENNREEVLQFVEYWRQKNADVAGRTDQRAETGTD